jgi:membrane associated rhomboid family serine protease
MDRCVTAAGGKFVVELRRLVMPIFLHVGFFHILFNVMFQVLSCPRALASYGSRRFLVLFLATGTCGNLLSGAAGHSGVGASTSCYGVVGAFIVQAVTLWKQQEDAAWRNYIRNMLLLNCGMLLGWELINWNHLDHFGHLGGLLSGLCMGVILAPEGISILKWRITLAALVLGIFACMLQIFVLEEPIDCEQAWLQYSQG